MTEVSSAILAKENEGSKRLVTPGRAAAAALMLAICGVGLGAQSAAAQMRMPLPGGYRVGPQMMIPAIRGASRFGWEAGRQWSMRQYGRSADPGPYPGLRDALGLRRR
jgi:hypothetical protein